MINPLGTLLSTYKEWHYFVVGLSIGALLMSILHHHVLYTRGDLHE